MKKITFLVVITTIMALITPLRTEAQNTNFTRVFDEILVNTNHLKDGVETILLPQDMLKRAMPKAAKRSDSTVNRITKLYQVKIEKDKSKFANDIRQKLISVTWANKRNYKLYTKSSADGILYEVYEGNRNKDKKEKEFLIRIDNEKRTTFFVILGYLKTSEILDMVLKNGSSSRDLNLKTM